MKFTLEIELKNVAIQSLGEIQNAIRDSLFGYIRDQREGSKTIAALGDSRLVRDSNGSAVGKWEVVE